MPDEYIEGFGPKPGTPLGPLAPGAPGTQGVKFFDLPTEKPQTPIVPEKKGLLGTLSADYDWANTELARLQKEVRGGIQRGLLGGPSREAETPPQSQLAARLLSGVASAAVPGSVPQAAAMVASPVVAASRLPWMAKAGIQGGIGGVSAAADAPEGQRMLKGAIGGVLGAGGAALGAIASPNAAVREAQALRQGASARTSPDIKNYLSLAKDHPQLMANRATLTKMQRMASDNIQGVFDDIGKALPKNKLIQLDGLTQKEIDKYAAAGIQGVASAKGIPGRFDLALPWDEALAVVQKAKASEDPIYHRLEYGLVRQVEPFAPGKHKQAMIQYATDAQAIAAVREFQKSRRLPGGINPDDYPEYLPWAKEHEGSPKGKAIIQGTLGLAEGGPMTPWGAYRLGRAADYMKQSGVAKPLKQPGPLRQTGAIIGSEIPNLLNQGPLQDIGKEE